MNDNGKENLVYAVVSDTCGRKFIGKVEKGALEVWFSGEDKERGIVVHEPVQMIDNIIRQGDGVRIEVHTYPVDSMDVGIQEIVLTPAGYYYPVGHKLKALHETRWTELRALAGNLVVPRTPLQHLP